MKVLKEHEVGNLKIKDSIKRWTLNFTDIVGNSNKFYNLELIEDSNGKIFLHTQYGRVGSNPVREYRACTDVAQAEVEANKIIKSKLKKGYVEVALVKADVGSDVAKSKIETSVVSEKDLKRLGYSIIEEKKSTLHPAIQNVVKNWFGSIEQFVIDTLDTSKCALGQLSLLQINKGRDLLLEARDIVKSNPKDLSSLNVLTSKYYSNIPMNFGKGKLNADELRLDSNDKLDRAFDMLDSLENAKEVEKVLTKTSAIDDQYKSLKTEIEYVDIDDPVWKWIDLLFHKTRASNHSFLGKMRINNIFKLKRDAEYNEYIKMAEQIASLKNQSRVEIPDIYKKIWNKRLIESKDYEKLSESANILPLWHGSRTENFPKILQSKLKFRRPGFTVSGSMFDKNGGLYFSSVSTKSVSYSSLSGSYWAGGKDNFGYIFLSDVALGKSKIANGPYPFTKEGIAPCSSVYAIGGKSGVINDEMIVFTESQNWLRYIVEISNGT